MVNKITTPPTTSELIDKVNELVDDKQDVISDLATIRSGASLGATSVQPSDLSTYVTTNTAQGINGLKTIKNQLKVQSGSGDGALFIGANVNSTTLSNGVRKVARVNMPTHEDITLPMTIISGDTTGDTGSTIGQTAGTWNRIEFGGRPGARANTSPDGMAFCVATSHNSTLDKVIALEMDATQARFNVQPNYNGANLPTETYVDTGLATKQATLVSGTNIKTINNQSILGSGNLVIGGPIDTEISTSSTNAVQNKAIPNYIVSRGENLVTNGFATLGNNYNFSNFVYDGSDTYGAAGCFTKTSDSGGSRGSILTSELMPVDISQSYKLNYAVKNTTSTSTYDLLSMYDIDGNLINKGNADFVVGTTTTLAQDLKDGDTKVYLTNISSDWHTGQPGTTGAIYYRGLIFWNYQNSYGYTYPVGYYSRNWWYDLWNDDNDVDAVNGIITLKSAWNHGTFPAGTSVSQGTTSGGYVYGNANYTPTANEWTVKSAIFTPDRFRNATSYVRIGWLYNYSQQPNNVFKISSVSLTQNLSIKDALKNTDYATSTVGGVVKVLSTYGTNINDGVVTTFKASNADIDAKTHQYRPIVPYSLDYAVKVGVTTNANTLSSSEKTAACSWIGAQESNLVTSLSSSSTDAQYPSAKCVYDLIGDVETLLSQV